MSKRKLQRFATLIGSAVVRPAGASIGDHFVIWQNDTELLNAHLLDVAAGALNIIQAGADNRRSLNIRAFSDAQVNDIFAVQNAAGNLDLFLIRGTGSIRTQPRADDRSLNVRAFSDAQANDIFAVQNAAGNVDLLRVDQNGTLRLIPRVDARSLNIRAFSDVQASDIFAVQNTGATTDYFRISAAGKTVVGSGVLPNGGGVKHQRVAVGPIAAGGQNDGTFTWPVAFADTNYTVSIGIESNLAGAAIPPLTAKIYNKTAASIDWGVKSNHTVGESPTLHLIAFHD